jgi:hypothetical protein
MVFCACCPSDFGIIWASQGHCARREGRDFRLIPVLVVILAAMAQIGLHRLPNFMAILPQVPGTCRRENKPLVYTLKYRNIYQ